MIFFKKYSDYLYSLLGSLLIASGWGWYHLSKHNLPVLAAKIMGIAIAVYAGFTLAKKIFIYLTQRFKRHSFWSSTFSSFLDELFFLFSLFFLIFFSRTELASVAFVLLLFPLVGWRIDRKLGMHPGGREWQAIHRWLFILGYFIFFLQAMCQYLAYRYYILDANIKFFNIVLFRTVAITALWLGSFAVAGFLFNRLPRIWRYGALAVWSGLFIFNLAFWVTNITVLYFSGLYFSPVVWDHRSGSDIFSHNSLVYWLIGLGIVALLTFGSVMARIITLKRQIGREYWIWYQGILLVMGIVLVFGLSSFQSTPERIVFKNFYDRWRGTEEKVTLPLTLQKKLERFGLFYDRDADKPAHREYIFPTNTIPLLPDRLVKNHPNIVIIFLESFSARVTGVYNPRFADLTPGFNAMSADKDTTVFKNYFNASTPTITGTLSQLCSFLPPTGHNEIQNDRKLQAHHLLCFPELLKRFGGYKSINYLTAVDKEFAHKDGIFTSAGIDKVYGTTELQRYITGEPLAWGYSDHQLFPAVQQFLHDSPQPSVTMLATVDTHPPFNLAKDMISYGDGTQLVLNSFHTTDDAFLKFWNTFKASKFATNTIVLAVADHAIFPSALTSDLFTSEADTLSYYDENLFLLYVPDTVLPKEVTTTASGIDIAPTLLHLLNINVPTSFEGHSIFADQKKYPNLVGMHELGLYINELLPSGKRKISYDVPDNLDCAPVTETTVSSTAPLTLCELLQLYKWKRQMFEEGRWWEN